MWLDLMMTLLRIHCKRLKKLKIGHDLPKLSMDKDGFMG